MIDQLLREALAHLPRVVVFVELTRQGSFRETAKVLGLSPSTVTHHIKALEEALGVRLIERTSRSMTLTAAGQGLLKEVEGIVGLWKRGSTSARVYAGSPVGNLVVTAPDVVAELFVVPAIGLLLERHERVEVDLRVSTLKLDLIEDGVDVAVRSGPLRDSNYGVRVLHRGQHGIVATPALAEVWQAKHPRELDLAPWVRFTRDPAQVQLVGPDGQSHALQGRSRARGTSAGSFIGLVKAGAGFGLIPQALIREELLDGSLIQLLPEWSLGPLNFYAVTPSPRATDIKVRLFTDILAEVFQRDSG